MTHENNEQLKAYFDEGGVLAYPTEAVYGLGCDPDNESAVLELLSLKDRPAHKGLILIADTYSRLLPYVDDEKIALHRRAEIFSSWPGHVTWLLPKSKRVRDCVCGDSDYIATRVTTHKGVKSLCQLLDKPLISTSANKSGEPPALSEDEVKQQFGDAVKVIHGELGKALKPSLIRHSVNGEVIRAS
jgi:L-threonylcarbamoyladenylate synthase